MAGLSTMAAYWKIQHRMHRMKEKLILHFQNWQTLRMTGPGENVPALLKQKSRSKPSVASNSVPNLESAPHAQRRKKQWMFCGIPICNHFLPWLPQIEKISAIPWQHSEFLAGFCLLHMTSGYGYCGRWPPKKLTHGSSEPESAPHRSDHLSFQGRFGRIRLVSFTACSKIALFEGTHI